MRKSLEHISLLFFSLVTVIPLVAGMTYAFLYSLGIAGILNKGLTGAYWLEAVGSKEILFSFLFSSYIAFVSIVIAIVIALFFTLGFHRSFRKGPMSFLIYLPLAIPAMVAAFFTFQLLADSGLISRLSYQIGWIGRLESFPDMVNDRYAVGIIVTHIMMAFPFFILLFLNLYRSEHIEELSQLASSLGAGGRQSAFRIAIPILLRKSFPTLALYYIFVLGSYEIPLILGRQSPQMVSVTIIRKLKRFNLLDIPEAYIIALIYTLLVLILVFVFFRKRRMAYDI